MKVKTILVSIMLILGLGSVYASYSPEEVVNNYNPEIIKDFKEKSLLDESKAYIINYINNVKKTVEEDLYKDNYKKVKKEILEDNGGDIERLINNKLLDIYANVQFVYTTYSNYILEKKELIKIKREISKVTNFEELYSVIRKYDNYQFPFGANISSSAYNYSKDKFLVNLIKGILDKKLLLIEGDR